jgi:hypothetical protein
VRLRFLALALLFLLPSLAARAQADDPNACDAPGDVPNVIVGDLFETQRWGKVGDITAFSIGTYSCNVGTCWLDWITGNNDTRHPTIGQNAFRLMNGRFEQVGQSWLKHGFYALSDTLCSPACLPTDGEHLGVNCSDPYVSGLNGQQTRLGPKFEVNPLTGEHPHPVTMQDLTGDDVFKRLQIHDRDLDPALNAGARYFIEGQYVAADDARAHNQHDNASFREVRVLASGAGNWDFTMAGETQRTRPAILAWQDVDPSVIVTSVDDPDGGRFWLAAKATDLGNGTWSYEYAVHDLDSNRGAGTFSVPVSPVTALTALGFHDVDYHSGEPFDGTDWNPTRNEQNGSMTWSTVPFGTDPNANALRWGTLYNFRFVADAPPVEAVVTLGLFKPGNPGDASRIGALLIAPNPCDADGTCDAGETCVSCPGECSDGPDVDGDGVPYCADCDDNDTKTWGAPGEVRTLLAWKAPGGSVGLAWSEPDDPGSMLTSYEVLRSPTPADFVNAVTCLHANPLALDVNDAGAAAAGPFLSYLARGKSPCSAGLGTTGSDSLGRARSAVTCP